MKLKNTLLALCALLSLAACSKDDAAGKEGPVVATKLSVAVLSGGIGTKAPNDTHEREGEAYINSLTAFVFNADGSALLGTKSQSTTGSNGTAEINDIPASTEQVAIAVVANVSDGDLAGVATFGDLRNRMISLATQGQTSLAMSSALLQTQSALSPDGNYIGYEGAQNVDGLNTPLVLTRVASRVDVSSIQTAFAGTTLQGRRVRIDAIYVSDVKTTSHCISAGDWGMVEDEGAQFTDLSPVSVGSTISDGTPSAAAGSFYVLENGGAAVSTRLIIQATIEATALYRSETKLFSSVINPNGSPRIKRNYVYDLRVTFGSTSFSNQPLVPKPDPDPDPEPPLPPVPPVVEEGTLDVQVLVASWGVVVQNPSID